jgi:hypothetical protein
MLTHTLVSIPVEAGTSQTHIDTHSGIFRHYPRVYGNLVQKAAQSGAPADIGAVIVHPMSNFHGHFMLEPIAEAGIPIIGLNTRYAGNDAGVIMENCLLDVGAAVRFARERLQWKRVVLMGFSGGGPLVVFYQRQAENPTIKATPAGDPPDISRAGLLPADGVFLMESSKSRSDIMMHWIDPSVTDEMNPDSRDPELDLYAPDRLPPYDRAWIAKYRAAQKARMQRIDEWVVSELSRLRQRGIPDRAFIVHRTVADPRFLDVTIDPSDRHPGSLYGDPRRANEATGPMGRYTSLCAWLSTWSQNHSKADGVENIPHLATPIGILCLTADQAALQSDSEALKRAAPADLCTYFEMQGATHYLLEQPDAPRTAAATFRNWLDILRTAHR